MNWASIYRGTLPKESPPRIASASETTGLKCAPEIGPKVRISATRTAPVAIEFARSAIATLPPESLKAAPPLFPNQLRRLEEALSRLLQMRFFSQSSSALRTATGRTASSCGFYRANKRGSAGNWKRPSASVRPSHWFLLVYTFTTARRMD